MTPEEYLKQYGQPPESAAANVQDVADYKAGFHSGVLLGDESPCKNAPYHSFQRKGWELGIRYRANHGDEQ